MIIQISSGQGPAECELAVGKFYDVIKKEYPDIKEITSHMSRFSGCYTSIMFETGHNLYNGFVKVLSDPTTKGKTGL